MLFCSTGSQKFKTTLTRLNQEASFFKKKQKHVFIWLIRVLAVALGNSIVSCGPSLCYTDSLIAVRTGPVAHRTWDPSSLTMDRAQVPCIATWILNHWTTRETPKVFLLETLGDNPFPRWFVSRDVLHFSAHGLFLHLQSPQGSISKFLSLTSSSAIAFFSESDSSALL